MKSNKWMILGAVYLILFGGVIGYGAYQYQRADVKIRTLQEEKQQLAENVSSLTEAVTDADAKLKEKQTEIETQQSEVAGYEQTLSGLDVYAQQIETVRGDYGPLLGYVAAPLEYNFDKELTESNKTTENTFGILSDITSGLLMDFMRYNAEGQSEINADIMVEVNKQAEYDLFVIIQNINTRVNEMNAKLDMYQTFVESDDLDEQFVNLQVLQEITETQPISGDILVADKEQLLQDMTTYYYMLKSVCDIYEFVLTDSVENQNYIANMRDGINELENLFDTYGITPQISELDLSYVLDGQREIKSIMDRVDAKATVLPSIPIANQSFSRYTGDGDAAKVYHTFKDTSAGKKLVYIKEENNFDRGNACMVFNASGEPVYVEVNGGYVYFYNGMVLESTIEMDTALVYNQAVWFYQNIGNMTNEEYFANTLTEM